MIAINLNAKFDEKDASPLFLPGDLILHRRYGYRGVVVAVDRECQADFSWYVANQTQPPRDQPWYHILVHGVETTTYAAQSSLMADLSGEEIRHPLLMYFFREFRNGRYVRNSHKWPDTSP